VFGIVRVSIGVQSIAFSFKSHHFCLSNWGQTKAVNMYNISCNYKAKVHHGVVQLIDPPLWLASCFGGPPQCWVAHDCHTARTTN
jgi:hypothetical protein